MPPDDTPAIRVGATIFARLHLQQQPKITDADGNDVTLNAFNVGRAYINVTGNISHLMRSGSRRTSSARPAPAAR